MNKKTVIIIAAIIIGFLGYVHYSKHISAKVFGERTAKDPPVQSWEKQGKPSRFVDDNTDESPPTISSESMDKLNENIDHTSPEEQRYSAALTRFHVRLRKISSASLKKEQEDLNKLVEASRSATMNIPVESFFIDRFGNRWIKRVFDEQVTRYDFVPAR